MATFPCKTALAILAGFASAQNITKTNAPSATVNGSAVANPTLFATALNIDVEDLWNLLVGPVSIAETTTTVSPTPIPASSLVPPPGLYYSPFPSGQEVFGQGRNESWSFPKDFWWGVAGASYQIEGAAKHEGRGPSIWDALSHRVENHIVDNTTGDVADNNYYMYKQDIARLAAIGVKAYSFSLSWSRIMPFGKGPVNQEAIAHYSDVVNTCIEYGITPQITLYHWDLPLYLQDTYGGWLDEEIVGDFVEYARIAFAAFGDRVSTWFTVNEPIVFCGTYPLPNQYFKNIIIPNEQQKYFCGHHVLLAHSQAYHLGKSMMPGSQITFKNNGGWKVASTNSTDDALATQRAWDFNEGWFADPVFLTGDYPQSLKEYLSTFLPDFTEEQKQAINGSGDFFAHDAYSGQFYFAPDGGVAACVSNTSNPLYPTCSNTTYTYSSEQGMWVIGPSADPGSPWLHKTTDWVPAFLHYMQDTWKPAGGIAITEFGFSEPFEARKTLLQDILTDSIRQAYFRDYMKGILAAMSEGVKVVGTLAWSFVDNFEWQQGYSATFGMQYVNFTDPARPRYFKASFFEYVRVFELYQEK